MSTTYYLALIFLYVWVFFLGACIGSFLNVLIYRIPLHISFVGGRSFCPRCHHMIRAYDNIPIISWIILRGCCRDCGEPISIRYPAVELLTGIVFVLTFFQFGFTPYTIILCLFSSVLITLAFIDMDTCEIPNQLVITILILAIVEMALNVIYDPHILLSLLIERGIGMICISIPMLVLTLIIPGAFGGGDIKLMAAAGLILGWQRMLVAMFVALLLGGGYAIYLMVSGKVTKGTHIPFGPALSVGLIFSIIYGVNVVRWYGGFFI